MTNYKAMIAGFLGKELSSEEISFFKQEKPWGYIIFERNIESPDQLRELTAQIQDIAENPNVPILIDQEGGRVQRMKQPHWRKYPTGEILGAIHTIDREKGLRAAWLQSRIMGQELKDHGINVDCLPVLDVPVKGAHDVIGDRAYSHDPHIVAEMGRAACEGLLAAGVLPVVKHIPGHGRAFADSHLELPVVDTPHAELSATDFVPFKALNDQPLAMSAHVVYTDIDAENCATTSSKIIDKIIRDEIGFGGLLMSDDLSMKALSGDFVSKTKSSFAAGCDVVLHCNGNMEEMVAIASATPELTGKPAERAGHAAAMIGEPESADIKALRAEFEELLSLAVA